jgi:hypothetical protein
MPHGMAGSKAYNVGSAGVVMDTQQQINLEQEPGFGGGDHLLNPGLPLPNLFIVGAPKAGTTSLYAYLRRHPEVFMPERKEPHYFSDFVVDPAFDNFNPPVRDAAKYQQLFVAGAGFRVIGEGSSSYLSDKCAAARIKNVVPAAKIIISLRNPVQRAFSHYLMERREGREVRSFKEALAADQSRSRKGWGISAQYIELGLYADQVKRYLDLFGPENVLVVLFEDLKGDADTVMKEVARFLGIDPDLFPQAAFDTVYNPFAVTRGTYARWILRFRPLRVWTRRWLPRSIRRTVRDRLLFRSAKKPKLESDAVRLLADRFTADLDRLERMLGRNLAVLRDI